MAHVEKIPPLAVSASARASAFVQAHEALGLSSPQIVFLAQLRRLTERASLQVDTAARRSMLGVGDDGLWRISEAAKRVRGPEDVERLRQTLVRRWATDSRGALPEENAVALMNVIHGPALLDAFRTFERALPEIAPAREACVAAVAATLVRPEAEPSAPSSLRQDRMGRHALRAAAVEAGLQSVSWNQWLYPPGAEGALAAQLTEQTQRFTRATGLPPQALGVGSLVRLDLDVESAAPSLAVYRASGELPSAKVKATPLAGSYRLALDTKKGWAGLGREWLDAAHAGARMAHHDAPPPPASFDLSNSDVAAWLAGSKVKDGLARVLLASPSPNVLEALSHRRASVGLPKPAQVDSAVFKALPPRRG